MFCVVVPAEGVSSLRQNAAHHDTLHYEDRGGNKEHPYQVHAFQVRLVRKHQP